MPSNCSWWAVDDLGRLGEERNLAQHLVAAIAVLVHDRDFFRVKRAGLAQDGIRNRHLADVVQERAAGDHPDLVARQAHGPGHGDGEGGDALGVALGLGVLQVERVAQRFQGDVVGAFQVLHGVCAAARCGPLTSASRLI